MLDKVWLSKIARKQIACNTLVLHYNSNCAGWLTKSKQPPIYYCTGYTHPNFHCRVAVGSASLSPTLVRSREFIQDTANKDWGM